MIPMETKNLFMDTTKPFEIQSAVTKSRHVDGGLYFMQNFCFYPGHYHMYKAHRGERVYDNKEGIIVPYEFYSRTHKKWKYDELALTEEEFVRILNTGAGRLLQAVKMHPSVRELAIF